MPSPTKTVKVYYGPTGTGKTRTACEENPDFYMWVDEQNSWFHGYSGQEVCVMDGFRGQLPVDTLLRLVDVYPTEVPVKGAASIPFTSKTVILCSPVHPKLWYPSLGTADGKMDQLMRRISEVRWFGEGPEPDPDAEPSACDALRGDADTDQRLDSLQRHILQSDDTTCFAEILAILDETERRVHLPGGRKRPRNDGLPAFTEQVQKMRRVMRSLQSFQVQVNRLMLNTVSAEMALLAGAYTAVVHSGEGGTPAAAPYGRSVTQASHSSFLG